MISASLEVTVKPESTATADPPSVKVWPVLPEVVTTGGASAVAVGTRWPPSKRGSVESPIGLALHISRIGGDLDGIARVRAKRSA